MPNKSESTVWNKTCLLLKSESSHFFYPTSWIMRISTFFNVLRIFFLNNIKAYIIMQRKRYRLLLWMCCNIPFKWSWFSTSSLDTSNFTVWISVKCLPGLRLTLYTSFLSWETFLGFFLQYIWKERLNKKILLLFFFFCGYDTCIYIYLNTPLAINK